MSFRTWLVTCTSLTMLALAPVGAAQAQDAATDPALLAAAEAFQADASASNRQALAEACLAAGYSSLEECFAALRAAGIDVGGAGRTNRTPPPAQPEEQPAPVEPTPQPDQPVEQPAPEQPIAPQQSEAPAQPPARPAQNSNNDIQDQLVQAVNAYNDAVARLAAGNKGAQRDITRAKAKIDQLCGAAGFGDTDSCLAQFGLSLSPLPAAPEEPAPRAPVTEQPAPEQPAVEPPPAEQPSVEPPASQEPAAPAGRIGGRAGAQIKAEVDAYNAAAARLDGGDAAARADAEKAKARIDELCSQAGFADTDSCLAQLGLTLSPLPGPTSSETPISELPNASEVVTPDAIEVLPPTVKPEDAAPILDSAKDEQNLGPNRPDGRVPPPAPDASSEPPAPPPQDDKAAQEQLPPPPPEVQSTQTERGTPTTIEIPKPVFTPPPGQPDVVIVQPPKADPGATIIQIGQINIIINIQQERDRYYDPREDRIIYEDLSRGRLRETVIRPNGVRIVTIYSRDGEVLQRSKILPDGREIILSTYDPRYNEDEEAFYLDPGRDLPPLHLTIPASDYVLDADSADDDQVAFFLGKPPVEQVRRIYTVDEVKHSARLRDSVRRLEVGNLTFDSGKATIARTQVGALSTVANAMQKLLDRNPGEVFLIEGHTDAVGSDISNLVLSDQRAATVARILTDFYDIPAENLVTQGYGERYLKVKTDLAEPLNRRVTIKRITPLVSYEASR